jgi:hypothetical protein
MGVRPGKDGVRRAPSDATFVGVLANCEVCELVTIIGQWMLAVLGGEAGADPSEPNQGT